MCEAKLIVFIVIEVFVNFAIFESSSDFLLLVREHISRGRMPSSVFAEKSVVRIAAFTYFAGVVILVTVFLRGWPDDGGFEPLSWCILFRLFSADMVM